jgi:nicotinate-nucleotide pyrophosphorylase (carboxylating)
MARLRGRPPRGEHVTLARIPALARLGVDIISAGALTHSVKAADVGLDFAVTAAPMAT